MNLAIGVLLIWFGSLLIYVAVHGIGSTAPGFWSIWQQALSDISGGQTSG